MKYVGMSNDKTKIANYYYSYYYCWVCSWFHYHFYYFHSTIMMNNITIRNTSTAIPVINKQKQKHVFETAAKGKKIKNKYPGKIIYHSIHIPVNEYGSVRYKSPHFISIPVFHFFFFFTAFVYGFGHLIVSSYFEAIQRPSKW